MKFAYSILIALSLLACGDHSVEHKTAESSQKNDTSLLNPNWYNVGFLIMDGTFNTELTAPFDIFHHTKFRDGIKAMNVFTLAKSFEPITTFEGIQIIPDFNYLEDNLPNIDILVVPSAEHHLDSDLEDVQMLNFIRKVDESAMFITSHCDGAFVLAEAGLLNNAVSTTFPNDIEEYQSRYPNLEVADSVLFVHDGKYITSAGGAKSFEASLYLCELLYGKEIANQIAEGMVIDWELDKLNYLKL